MGSGSSDDGSDAAPFFTQQPSHTPAALWGELAQLLGQPLRGLRPGSSKRTLLADAAAAGVVTWQYKADPGHEGGGAAAIVHVSTAEGEAAAAAKRARGP